MYKKTVQFVQRTGTIRRFIAYKEEKVFKDFEEKFEQICFHTKK